MNAQARLAPDVADADLAMRIDMTGRFAAGIAHDLNNLLNVVLAAADQIVARPGTDPTTRDDAAQIHAAARRGAALLRHLLGAAEPPPSPSECLDLCEAVGDLAPLLRHLLGDAIRLELDTGTTELPVRLCSTAFDQVVLNLAANARDAMPKGGRLTLRCGETWRDRTRFASLVVQDTGTGIPPELLGRIFEPFFTTHHERGTGLGLATVNDIVTGAGGFLAVDSKPGRGTSMQVALPLAVPVPAAGGTVLLVEDEPVARRLAERALTTWGWQVVTAASAEAALEAAGPFVAVVTDMELPGRNGAALVAALRALPGGAGLPAIIVSGHAEAALRRDGGVQALLAVASPPTELLCKPFALTDLRTLLAAITV